MGDSEHSKFPTDTLYISELGEGWGITFLETQEEYDFVISQSTTLTGANYYVIGGSPSADWSGDLLEILDYSLYSTKRSGNVTVKYYISMVQLLN